MQSAEIIPVLIGKGESQLEKGYISSRIDSILAHMRNCNKLITEKVLSQFSDSELEFRERGLDKCEKMACISVTDVIDEKYFNINVLYLSGIVTISVCDMYGRYPKRRMFKSPYPCIAQDPDMIIDYFDEFLDGFTLEEFDTFKPKQAMVQEIKLS